MWLKTYKPEASVCVWLAVSHMSPSQGSHTLIKMGEPKGSALTGAEDGRQPWAELFSFIYLHLLYWDGRWRLPGCWHESWKTAGCSCHLSAPCSCLWVFHSCLLPPDNICLPTPLHCCQVLRMQQWTCRPRRCPCELRSWKSVTWGCLRPRAPMAEVQSAKCTCGHIA